MTDWNSVKNTSTRTLGQLGGAYLPALQASELWDLGRGTGGNSARGCDGGDNLS